MNPLMLGRWICTRTLFLIMVLPNPAMTDPSCLDIDDLAALLGDLEAHGVILDRQDLALIEEALRETEPSTGTAAGRGLWTVAVDWKQEAGVRLDSRLRRDDRRIGMGARWRGDGSESRTALWAEARGGVWRLHAGAGSLAHGSGLLSAPLGSRSSLGIDASLLPPSAGWRPSLSATMPERLDGVVIGIDHDSIDLQVGMGRDLADRTSQHVRLGLRTARKKRDRRGVHAGILGLRRGDARAAGFDLRWSHGPWRLSTEGGAWELERDQAVNRAWILAAGWSQSAWRVEFQTAGSRANGAMPGARKPACLSGWHGTGWALRMSGRLSGGFRLGLAKAGSEDRDPSQATGRLRERHVMVMSLSGPIQEHGTWQLRWKRQDEVRRTWDSLQPWLPAQEDHRRERNWWTLQADRPVPGRGVFQIAGRRLEEAGKARNLLGFGWMKADSPVRIKVRWQMAWGDPLDLVSVSSPISSMIALRHWGSWDNGLQFGVQAHGRWRWQAAVEVRRRSRRTGGGLVGEGRFLWGRGF